MILKYLCIGLGILIALIGLIQFFVPRISNKAMTKYTKKSVADFAKKQMIPTVLLGAGMAASAIFPEGSIQCYVCYGVEIIGILGIIYAMNGLVEADLEKASRQAQAKKKKATGRPKSSGKGRNKNRGRY